MKKKHNNDSLAKLQLFFLEIMYAQTKENNRRLKTTYILKNQNFNKNLIVENEMFVFVNPLIFN